MKSMMASCYFSQSLNIRNGRHSKRKQSSRIHRRRTRLTRQFQANVRETRRRLLRMFRSWIRWLRRVWRDRRIAIRYVIALLKHVSRIDTRKLGGIITKPLLCTIAKEIMEKNYVQVLIVSDAWMIQVSVPEFPSGVPEFPSGVPRFSSVCLDFRRCA